MPFFLESSIYSTYYYYYNILILTNKREKHKKIVNFSEKMPFFCIFSYAPAFQRADDGYFEPFPDSADKKAPIFRSQKPAVWCIILFKVNAAASRRSGRRFVFRPGTVQNHPDRAGDGLRRRSLKTETDCADLRKRADRPESFPQHLHGL